MKRAGNWEGGEKEPRGTSGMHAFSTSRSPLGSRAQKNAFATPASPQQEGQKQHMFEAHVAAS